MSTSLDTLIRLRAIQNKSRALLNDMDEDTYSTTHIPALHSIAWHLACGIFIENYFLRDVIQGNKKTTKKLYPLFFRIKPSLFRFRPGLPSLKQAPELIKQQQDQNDIWLLEKTPPLSEHPLFENEYIENYIIQHYAKQYEQLQHLLDQAAINSDEGDYRPVQVLSSRPLLQDLVCIDTGAYEIGSNDIFASDIEQPEHSVQLDCFNIASQPVSNAEYLMFMESGGYQQQDHWSEHGWQWRNENNIQNPHHWKQNDHNEWYGIEQETAVDLAADDPVYGLSFFEACAFAHWAKARLPHENEWEAAARSNTLANTGQVLEWCHNNFFYYEGFKPFPVMPPLQTASEPHCNMLRGASKITRPERRRISIRHSYTADSRHIPAGLRLVFS